MRILHYGPQLFSAPYYIGFARQRCCMAEAMKMFSFRKNIFPRRKKNLLFLPCNMAAIQNLYFLFCSRHFLLLLGVNPLKSDCFLITPIASSWKHCHNSVQILNLLKDVSKYKNETRLRLQYKTLNS